MAWADNLLEASFRGVIFDCISTDDEISRAIAAHTYPYQAGAETEDLGEEAKTFNIVAVFYGDDYESRLKTFIETINVPGTGDLVHPIFGSISAQFQKSSIHHDSENVDRADVTLTFIQDSIAPKFFERTLSIQKATAVLQKNTAAREAATQVLSDEVTNVVNSKSFNRIEQLRTTMTTALTTLKTQVAGVISSGLDPVKYSTSWASDLTNVITSIVDLRAFDIDSLTADWKAVFSSFDNAVLLPAQARQPTHDVEVIDSHVALEQASGKADAASIVLVSETQTPTLSNDEIELMVNDARTDIELVIVQYRNLYDLEKSRPVTEALKDTASALQEAARAVIEARPPLVTRVMNAQGNYRLIAHRLYGDHTRAAELFRLNPNIKMPNFIEQGVAINAYAA